MQIANYLTTSNGAGEVGQYPLSTETLEFIQQQILLVERLSSVMGVNRPWIIKSPTDQVEGLLAYDGALYTLEGDGNRLVPGKSYRLLLREEYKDITTGDNRFERARKYLTAYIAPDDGAPTADREIGKVIAISSSEVMTPNSPSLNSLREMAATIPVETDNRSLVFGNEVPGSSKIFLVNTTEDNSPTRGIPMSDRELDGACLTTRVFKGCEKSYIQHLETYDGVKYKRVYIHPSEEAKLQGVNAYRWTCLPNQVIGSVSIHIRANHQVFSAELMNHTGVLREAKYNDRTRGKIEITPKSHVLLRTGAVRIEVVQDRVDAGRNVILGYNITRVDDPAVITINVPEVMQIPLDGSIILSVISR